MSSHSCVAVYFPPRNRTILMMTAITTGCFNFISFCVWFCLRCHWLSNDHIYISMIPNNDRFVVTIEHIWFQLNFLILWPMLWWTPGVHLPNNVCIIHSDWLLFSDKNYIVIINICNHIRGKWARKVDERKTIVWKEWKYACQQIAAIEKPNIVQ